MSKEKAMLGGNVGSSRRSRRTLAAAALYGVVIAGASLALPEVAHAVSGEDPASVGAFGASCGTLRTETGVQGDVVFACDPNGEACEIAIPGANRETRSGIAATGFCEDSFPIQGPTDTPPGVIKEDIVVQGSTFSAITGVKSAGAQNEASNIICSTFTLPGPFTVGTGNRRRTFGPGVRVCRKIVPCSGPACSSPATCPGERATYFVTRADDCSEVRELVTGTLTGTPPNFAFAVFTDVNSASGSVSQPGRQALLVCPGYQAQCVNASNRAQPAGTVGDYRLPLGAVQENPDCFTTSKGYRYPKPPC
jgi:hypothetical protein